MIKNLPLWLVMLFFVSTAQAQITSTSATYNAGAQEIERIFGGVDTSDESVCVDTLIVTIPNGNYIYSIDIEYDLTAFGTVWTSDLESYLELASEGKKEWTVTQGQYNTDTTEAFARTGLTFANGLVSNGQLKFVLHAFRTFGVNACDTINALVVDSTFKVTVNHGLPPTCFPPSNPIVNWTMDTKAQLTWTTGGASSWQIEYGTPGFTPGSGTLVNATSNPFVLTGLSASTAYDFIVRDSCGVADVSSWSLAGTFNTLCTPSASPFTENFDGTAWSEGTGGGNAGNTIDLCWERNPEPAGGFGAPFAWGTGSGGTPTGATGPSGDNTTGNDNYMYTEASLGAYQAVATLSSPLVDLGALTNPEIEFYYHMFGNSVGQLNVDIWNQTNGWVTIYTVSGQQQNSSTQAWNKESITLSNYVNDTVRVRFRAIRSFNAQGDIAIDDVKFQEAPSCPKPSNIVGIGIFPGGTTIGWTAATATNWDVQYGLMNFNLGSGTIQNTNTNPTTISGLTPGATYDFYVRERCSSTDTSDWEGPFTVSIPCFPISTPYFEDYDALPFIAGTGVYNLGDTLANCHLRAPLAGSNAGSPYYWGVRSDEPTTPGTGPTADYSGSGNFMYTESSAGTPGQVALYSIPTLDLSPLTSPELRFWYHMFGASMGQLAIDVYELPGTLNSNVFTLSGPQTASANGAWQEAIVDLSAFAGDTVIIIFRAVRGTANTGDIAIDEVRVEEAPTCPDPSALAASNITSTTVDLAWTTGGANNWNIAFGTPGFTPGGTFASASTNPFTLSGLTPATTYDIYVRDSCGTGDVSNWIGPITITTLCAPTSAPYAENFDGTVWVEGPNQTPGIIDPCWTRSDTTTYWWKPGTGGTPSANTGPSGDHTTGSGNYLFTETNGGGTSTSISTPIIDVSSLTSPELTFYYHMFGGNISSLIVEVNDGSGWNVEATISGAQQTASTDGWIRELVDLSGYANDTIQIRFAGTRTAGFLNQVDIAIDDIDLHEAPTCLEPTNLATTATTANSVTLSWTTGGATAWQIEYGPVGFAPGAGTIVNAPTNPFTVTGLSAATTYDFYVRDDCGSGDTSLWVGPATDNTSCTVASAPYLENFDFGFDPGTGGQNVGSTIGACWARNPASGYHWGGGTGATPSANTGPSADHTSGTGNYVYTEASSGGGGGTPQIAELESPFIEMSALTNPRLTFWYHINGTTIGSFDVEVFDGSTWNNELTITTSQGNAWLEANIPLTSYIGDTIKVRFTGTRAIGAGAFVGDLAVDDFSIEESPSCPKPQNFAVNSIGSNSVTLGWTTGGATLWNIEYGPVGFTPGSGTYVVANTNPFAVTGLSLNTAYEFYVRDSCGNADVSDWVGPVNATTPCGFFIAPFTENFDIGFDPGTGGQNVGSTIGACWVRNPAAGYHWGGGTGATPSAGTGPAADHTSGTGNYVYTEASITGGGGTPLIAELESPSIEMSALTNPRLTFWYHINGTGIGIFDVEVFDGSTWNNELTITTSQGNAWLEAIIPLTSYIGDTIKVRFIGTRATGAGAFLGDLAIDDFSIEEAPSCPKPQNLVVNSVGPNSVTLGWTTGGATLWNIEYGPVGFTPGSGTYVVANANPFAVSGLNPTTTYEFYVRDSCGTADVSDWVGPVSATTLCGVFTAPFVEDFDGTTWIPGAGGFAAGTIDPCWTRSAAAQYWWRPGNGPTPTGQTGPSGDHTSGNGQYIYTESFNGSTSTNIESPLIDLSALTSPELTFWYHMYGALINDLTIEINNGSGWALLDTIIGQQQTSQPAPWLERIIDLSSYANDTVQIRFTGNKTAGNQNSADISIDDFRIDEAPSCPQPTNLAASTSTTTSVTLSWTTGGATDWQIEYGPIGFAPGSGTIVNAGTNPFTVTGLSPAQNYDFYVRDSCGIADVSSWLGPVPFATLCGTVLAPYFENFDVDFNPGTGLLNDGSTISPCWTRNPDSAYHWGGGTGGTSTFGTGPTGDHTSGFGNYVYAESSSTPNGSEGTLETPSIDLTPLTTPEMHFWYHMWTNNGTQGTLTWEVFSNNNWIVLDSLVGDQGNSWQELVVDLSAYANQTIKIRFRGRKGNGPTPQQGDIAIDDLSIIEAPTCPDPSLLTATTLTLTSVELSWTTGGAVNWQIEYGPVGFTPGSGTLLNVSTNPYTVTGLTQATSYDFYVRDSCGTNDFSNWIGPVDATTFNCVNGCAYELELTDTFGDGWTGNFPGTIFHELSVTVGNTTTSYTLLNGFDTIIPLNVCDNDTLIFNFTANGQWANECGVILRDPNGTVVYQNTNALTTGQIFTGSASCNNPCPTPTAVISNTANFLDVSFDGTTSTGTNLSYQWDFGDGTTDTARINTHTYAADGTYTITLITTDACNQSDTASITITVCAKLIASYTWTQNGLTVNTDASALTNATSFTWIWGDGTTSNTGSTDSHTYSTTGTFQLRLIVTNLCGQTDDTTIFVDLCVKPIANWTYSIISSGSGGMQVQFDGTSSINGNSFSWDFGDGNTNTTSAIPVHTYSTAGLFWVVTLIVENSCGESDTLKSSLAQINIDEQTLGLIEVYPNPASERINVKLPLLLQQELIAYRLVDLRGNILSRFTSENENEVVLDIGQYPAGSYVLEIQSKSSIIRKQIIISR